jgi:hypothetical protein
MEANNFEKQIQEKLAELKIQPSEKSWAGIESRIGKKDSRRKIFWFLLVGFFILACGGYLFLFNGKNARNDVFISSKNSTKSDLQKKENYQENLSDSIRQSAQIATEISAKQSSNKSNRNKNHSIKSAAVLKPQKSIGPIEKNKKEANEINFIDEQLGGIKISKEQSEETKALNSYDLETNEVQDPVPVAGMTIQNPVETLSGNEMTAIESQKKKQEEITAIKKDIPLNENSDLNNIQKGVEIKKTSSSSTNWEVGLSVSAAKAFIGEGIGLGLFNPDKSNMAHDPEFYYNFPSIMPGSSFGQASTGPATSPENSFGLIAGITLKKDISPKTSFVTGLNYKYYTNAILIGNRLSAGNYSSAGYLSSYRNNVHFIELPALIQYRVNSNSKIPLNLSTGFTLSQLISSDAVQYKSGFYERDNSLFNKTQFGITAGFSATFFKKISVGPFYNYGLNSLAKEGLYGKKHLNFLGIKADFIFQKK